MTNLAIAMAHHQLLLKNPASGGSFAAWDPTRKGTGVTLTSANLRAQIAGLYMVAATNPQPINTGSPQYYAEFSVNLGATTFWGVGISIAGSLTDSYQGAYAGQCTSWWDSSHDEVSGLDVAPNRPDYHTATGVKVAFNSNGLFYGLIGVGWWNTTSSDWTGDVTTSGNAVIRSVAAGSYSLGVSSIAGESADVTANFGSSAFIDTPPSGYVGWPA